MYENKPEKTENIIQEETQNKGQEGTENFPKRKAPPRVRSCIIAVCIAMGSFLGGVLTRELMLDPDLRSLIKLKEHIQKYYYEEVTDDEFYNVLFESVNEKLLDDYSWYMGKESFQQSKTESTGAQEGLGIVFRTMSPSGEEQMLVSRVCGNSPAESVGIAAGDYVIGFGRTEKEMTESNVFSALVAFLQDLSVNETFFMRLRSGANGEERTVTLSKQTYVENYVFYRTNTESYRFMGENALELTASGQPLTSLDNDTAYIRLVKFNGAAAEEFAKAMAQFKKDGKKNLVLDLRGNGGGYLDIMQKIASYFCKDSSKSKPVVAIADYGKKQTQFRASGNVYKEYFSNDSRICVLADSDSASASECLIGCMVDYGTVGYDDICLAKRSGIAKTYGKGIMQTTYPLSLMGDAVKLTTAKIIWPVSKKCIHDVGVNEQDGALTVEENPVWESETDAAIQRLFS